MIDFSLSPAQQETRKNAAAFAAGVLKGARAEYIKLPNDGVTRFKSTKPLFETATKLGLIKSLVPAPLGGTGGTLVDAALITEELFAVEPSVAINLLTVNLGLMPLFFSSGTAELQKEILVPFLNGEGAPLASLQFSEPTGSANYMEKGGKGMQTTARKDGTDWIINGEKLWAGNSCGWDEKGADVQTLVCRNVDVNTGEPADSALVILATRAVIDSNAPGAFSVVKHMETPGFTAACGAHVKYTNLRIPEKFVVASGATAEALVDLTFTASAAMVGAMSVGIMRTAFESALKFAKEKDQGGSVKLLERQSVADLLIEIKMRIDTSRMLTWKAAHSLDTQTPGADELCFESKIYCSEACVKSVAEAMRVVGISSYSKEYPFAQLMEDALVLPIFDGGNQGVRRRAMQAIFLQENYDPWRCTFGGKPTGQTNEPDQNKLVHNYNPPKRGLSAYMYFANDARDKLRTEEPKITFGEVGKTIKNRWEALSDAEREPYLQKAAADTERYEKKMAELTNSSQ